MAGLSACHHSIVGLFLEEWFKQSLR